MPIPRPAASRCFWSELTPGVVTGACAPLMASPMVPNENSIARTSGTTGQGKGRPPLKVHRLSSRGNAELGHTHGELEALADALFGYRTGTVSLASTGLRKS